MTAFRSAPGPFVLVTFFFPMFNIVCSMLWAEMISIDAGLLMERLTAFILWEFVVDVLNIIPFLSRHPNFFAHMRIIYTYTHHISQLGCCRIRETLKLQWHSKDCNSANRCIARRPKCQQDHFSRPRNLQIGSPQECESNTCKNCLKHANGFEAGEEV